MRDPFLGGPSNFKHLRCLHLLKQIPGDAASTDLGTFRFEPDFLGTGMAVLIQGLDQAVFVVFRTGLIGEAEAAKAAAAVVCQAFKIHHGDVAVGQRQQEISFSAASPAAEQLHRPGA